MGGVVTNSPNICPAISGSKGRGLGEEGHTFTPMNRADQIDHDLDNLTPPTDQIDHDLDHLTPRTDHIDHGLIHLAPHLPVI